MKSSDNTVFKRNVTGQKDSCIENMQLHQQLHHNQHKWERSTERRDEIEIFRTNHRISERRKTFDKKGSFAIIMAGITKTKLTQKFKRTKRLNITIDYSESAIIKGIGCDHRSGFSASTHVRNDFTMQGIEEDITYFNT